MLDDEEPASQEEPSQPGSQSPSPTRQTVGQVIGCINLSCRICAQDGYGFFCIKFPYVDLSTQNQYQYAGQYSNHPLVLQGDINNPYLVIQTAGEIRTTEMKTV